MYDPRMKKLADVLVGYSTEIKAGEVVYVEAFDIPKEMLEILVDRIYKAEAIPLISQRSFRVLRKIYRETTQETMKLIGDIELYKMKKADAYIGMKAPSNITEHSDVPQEKWNLFRELWWKPVHLDWRVSKTRWVTLRWPTPAMAQQARMPTDRFEDFYFDTCTMDYQKMSKAMIPLKRLMEKTDEIWIKGPRTDLRFSIKNIPVVINDGHENLPDGEIFTAPVKTSLEGIITFNAPTIHMGKIFTNIRLKFKEGKIIKATSSDTKTFNKIIDNNEGSRYIGEFALGLNPYITQPITDILFDEKIAGSIHFALGNAYEKADNYNRSKIHWDLVLLQTKEWGGGEIYFDERLIRKNGIFVLNELKLLNPEKLKI